MLPTVIWLPVTPVSVAPPLLDVLHEAEVSPLAPAAAVCAPVDAPEPAAPPAEEAAPLVAHRGKRRVLRGGRGRETRGQCLDAIAMAHPHVEHGASARIEAIRDVIEQAAGADRGHFRMAELPCARARN